MSEMNNGDLTATRPPYVKYYAPTLDLNSSLASAIQGNVKHATEGCLSGRIQTLVRIGLQLQKGNYAQ